MATEHLGQVRSRAELVQAIRNGAAPHFLFFWGHRPRPDGFLGPSCLSQWWPAPFPAQGETFGSAEHYMMWRKAHLFADSGTAVRVLAAATPAEAKELGRGVRGYDDPVWRDRRWEVVVAGSVAKFSHDETLRDYLLSTGDQVLVETSPVDRVCGCGLAANSPDAGTPLRWPGENLLGFALMEARDRLR